MLVGFLKDFPQLHNPRKYEKNGAPLGGAQGTHGGALCGWDSPSHQVASKDVPLQLGNWRGKVDFLVSTLGGMEFLKNHHGNTIYIEISSYTFKVVISKFS